VGLIKRWLSTPGARAVMTRYAVALAAELKRNPGEPYELLRFAWLEAIEPYKQVDPPLHKFHLSSGVMAIACKVCAVLPLEQAMPHAATLTAALCYPAYSETADGQTAWAVLGDGLKAVINAPEPYNERFRERNPKAFHTTFQGRPFTTSEAEAMLTMLRDWAQKRGVQLRW
jgi:hypothetical protein